MFSRHYSINFNFYTRRILNSWFNRNIHNVTCLRIVWKPELTEQDHLNLKLLAKIYGTINFENITTRESQLLLKCCGTSSVDSPLEERIQMCNSLFEKLRIYGKLNLDIYHTYIQICTENRTLVNSQTFLENLKFQPDNKIYKVLLENVCECGDLSQALVLLEKMKHCAMPVDESIFNSLIMVHTFKGGLEAGEKVLATMKTAQVLESNETYIAILKGLIKSQNYQDFKKLLEKYVFSLDQIHTLLVLKELGLSQNVDWLPEMKTLLSDTIATREFINDLKNICTYLIYLKKSDSAVKLYTFFQSLPEENYGFFILEEMLNSNADLDEIIFTAKYFFHNHNTQQVFENLTEFAFKHKYFEISWNLFNNFNQLRPHFFWPLLVDAQNNEGEAGVLKTIEKINNYNLKLDSDSIEQYVLPFCNLEDATSVVEKLKKVGFTVREILSPMLLVLLKNGHVNKASHLCELYNVQIHGERLFRQICSSWKTTKNPVVVSVLQKFCEISNVEHDLVGDFLIISLDICKSEKDYKAFTSLLKAIHDKKLTVTTTSAQNLREMLDRPEGKREAKFLKEILDQIEQILDFKLKTEMNYIPHPRDMSLEELECHLVELTQKNMGTRGILRKLIQMHANVANATRVTELRQQFLDAGYIESLGMKASLMYTYTKTDNLKLALEVYEEIKNLNQNFIIDESKIIDLAILLVKNNNYSEAVNVLNEISKCREYGGSNLQRNCVQLLNAIQEENEQMSMLQLLVAKKFCKYNNIMLGPLIKIHLNRGNLEEASSTYVNLAEKFKCTPLQFELIREIAKTRNEELLQKVLDSTSKIHGASSTQVTLISALAEIGEEKVLGKILNTTQFNIKNEVNKRCVRWIKEGKTEALITLAKSCRRITADLIDIHFIYDSIMKTYAMKNDCESAVTFYEGLLENEISIDESLENQLYTLLKQNNFLIPKSLQIKNRK